MKIKIYLTALLLSTINIAANNFGKINTENVVKDPTPVHLAAKESMAKTEVPNNFKLELVAAEPMVEEPVCMAWGPDGELYVAEMLTYMKDVDASGEKEPFSRVLKLVDTDGDGKMDKRRRRTDSTRLAC